MIKPKTQSEYKQTSSGRIPKEWEEFNALRCQIVVSKEAPSGLVGKEFRKK